MRIELAGLATNHHDSITVGHIATAVEYDTTLFAWLRQRHVRQVRLFTIWSNTHPHSTLHDSEWYFKLEM